MGASMKMVLGTWLFTSFIVDTVYRSNLKAMIIIPKETLPFDTLEELARFPLPLSIIKYTIIHEVMDVSEVY